MLGGLLAARIGKGSFKGFGRRPQVIRPIVVPGITRQVGFFASTELKFHDQDVNDPGVAGSGTIFTNASAEASLLRIPEGNGASARIGRKITVRQINWRFEIKLAEADGVANPANDTTVRVLLYLDKQANGAAAAVTDIVVASNFQSFNNLSNSKRFRTLMDRTYNLNRPSGGGNGTTSDWAGLRVSDTFFKKVNIPIEYNSTATDGSLATIRSNNINMLIFGSTADAVFTSKMRIRYSDQ